MDFLKSFDKVPHRRFMKKMEHYGIGEKTFNWVQDFSTYRKQNVSVNRMDSTTHNVSSGIPQGSVLGSILFVIYINDMPDCVAATAYLFVDDTKLCKEIRSPEDSNSLQRDLDSLQEWSNTWLLRFHPNKCKVMTVSNKKKYNQQVQFIRQYRQRSRARKIRKDIYWSTSGRSADILKTYSTAGEQGEQYYGPHKKNLFIPR